MRSPEAEAQLAPIRAEIQRYGQSIVGCDQLLLLVSKDDPIRAQFGPIFLAAERERWSFEFRTDGTVRFADLDSTGEHVEDGRGRAQMLFTLLKRDNLRCLFGPIGPINLS